MSRSPRIVVIALMGLGALVASSAGAQGFGANKEKVTLQRKLPALIHLPGETIKVTVTSADGTSASAPFWAGLVALADQDAGHALGFINPTIYRIGVSSSYHRAFHDITTGSNTITFPAGTVTGYQAGPGWDPVTGWGSPDAQVLVPLLAGGR